MKSSSFILKIIVTIMIISIAVLGVKKLDFFKFRTVEKNQLRLSTSESEKNNTLTTNDYNDNLESQTNEISPIDMVTYNLGESCETEEWKYCVNSVKVTKSGEGMVPFLEGHYTEDENGNLICDSSFIIADMEVTNNSSSNRKLYMNSSRINLYNYNNGIIDYNKSTEACAYTFNGDRSIYAKDFFRIDFQANETKTFRVGYVLDDELISEDFDIIRIEINHSGMAGFNENIRYYKICEKNNLKDLENV